MDLTDKKIAIYGGGVMGRGLAQLAAQSGFNVSLFNRSKENSKQSEEIIGKQIQKAVDKGRVSADEQEAILGRVSFHTEIAECLKGATLLIENLPENFDLKVKAFKSILPLLFSFL